MWHSTRFLSGLFLTVLSTQLLAAEAFVDLLYLKATETIDWVYDNNLNPTNQQITYYSADFDFEPGFRVGITAPWLWDVKFYYTRLHTETDSGASGNLTSGFMAGKLAKLNSNFFFSAGSYHQEISYDMLDFELRQTFNLSKQLQVEPIIGLKAGWIDQSMDNSLQGQLWAVEYVKHDFKGIGPKAGIAGKWTFQQSTHAAMSIIGDFSMAYLWGQWKINDVLQDSLPRTIVINVADRKLGSINVETMLGLNWVYQQFSVQLGYEISDWFNQCQLFDDATGAHNNDLLLQGLRLGFSLQF